MCQGKDLAFIKKQPKSYLGSFNTPKQYKICRNEFGDNRYVGEVVVSGPMFCAKYQWRIRKASGE
jgi:hypothetical protein